MRKVVILGGGNSSEREVSLSTSQTIYSALSKADIRAEIIDPSDYKNWFMLISELHKRSPDMIFIGLHGASGEDGRVQAMLELSKLKYTGSNAQASALAMNKLATLCLAEKSGIPVSERIALYSSEKHKKSEIISRLGLPIVVKPNASGSSVGISIVNDEDKLLEAIRKAGMYDRQIICEKYIEGKEITVTILNDQALPVVEINPKNGWYDYVNKYTVGNTHYICPAGLNEEETRTVQKYAERINKILGCQVYSRIDFRYDGERFYFLEVNTLPGMTALSLTPMAAKAAGYDLGALLLEILKLSQKKYKD